MSVFDEEDHQITSPQVEDPITEVGSPLTVGSPAGGQENPLSATHSHPPTTVMHGSMRSSDGSDSEPQINRSAPPIDDDDSSSSSSKAQLDLASPLFLLISFATLVLFAVAAPIRWFYRVQPAARTDYTLWQMTMQTTLAYQHATVGDYPCAEEARYYRNIEAFVLISIAGAVAMTIVGVLAWRGIVASVKIPATVTAAFTFVASLVCWGTAISLFFSEFCGTESFKRRRFDYDAGPVLVIVGWVFTAVSIVIVWVQPQISWPLTDRAAYRLVSKWYGALVIPAAIFSVILVPIPLFYYWSTQNDQIEISSFHYKYYKNDVLVGSVATGGTYCGQFGEVARVSQAFGIILIILSWSALVAWVLHYRSEATEYRPALYVVTAIAFLAAGIKLAMDIALYFEDYCDMGSLVDGAYQQGAGFALTATMVALHGFNLVILTWSIVRAWLRAKNVCVNPKEQWAEFVYLAALLITLPLVIVSIWKPLLHASSPMADLTYSWWDVQQKTTSSTVTNDFPKDCKEIKQRMAGGGSLVIIAAALLLMALFLQIGQFLTPILKKPAGIMGLVASVPLLVAWGIAIAAKHHGMFCSDLLANDKTKISYGLAFVISSWVVVLLASITVLVVPSATTTNKK